MADLNDDRKKEEEEYGGFEPDENDDESFMLEDENDYPAKLPEKFSDEASSTVPVTASVDSVDGDEEPIDNKAEEPIEEIEEVEENNEEEIQSESEIDEVIEDEIESEEIEEIPTEEEVEDETVEFDDDFKKKLQADIDRSKAKREAKEVIEEPQGDTEPAKQIGDDAETVVMLSDIDADKPSNAKSVEEPELPPIVGAVTEESETEAEVKKEKKKKKTPVWILMLYSSVATLLVTLGAVWLIWAFLLSDTEEHNPDEPHVEEVVENHEEHTTKHEEKAVVSDTMSEEERNWLDSMDIDKKDTLLTYQEDKEFFAGLEDEFDEEGHSKDKPKDNHIDDKEPKKVKPKVVPKKKKKEDIASNNVTKSVAPKSKKKSNVKIDESQFSMPQPKGPAPETGLFMVQIYSSPSREDAESWLGQLKARQVPNPMITEHEMKGRTWYRVRYGKFETKEAARSSALELGYSQSWIDRVK